MLPAAGDFNPRHRLGLARGCVCDGGLAEYVRDAGTPPLGNLMEASGGGVIESYGKDDRAVADLDVGGLEFHVVLLA
jgi:hypothetical protein